MRDEFESLSVEELRMRPSAKWRTFPEDVIPCWVADMDFAPARAIREEVSALVDEGITGYPPMDGLPGVIDSLLERMAGRYGLELQPEQVHMMPGIIPGLYLASLTMAGPGEGVVVQPPVYPPFMSAVTDTGRELVYNPMLETADGWRFDLEGLERAITPGTRLLMLCNPQNPTGRVFTREELEGLAEIVLRHRLWVVSDELHADLTLEGRHIPFASLGEEVAQRTLTLYGPTKAFTIAGLKIGFAFSHNLELLERVKGAGTGLVMSPNILAQQATLAAYERGGEWLDATVRYLRGNRDHLLDFVRSSMPGVRVHPTEGTYLAWLDLRELALDRPAAQFLLEEARVGLNPGHDFGPEENLDGFARLNFATSRPILTEALERMAQAVGQLARV